MKNFQHQEFYFIFRNPNSVKRDDPRPSLRSVSETNSSYSKVSIGSSSLCERYEGRLKRFQFVVFLIEKNNRGWLIDKSTAPTTIWLREKEFVFSDPFSFLVRYIAAKLI